MTELEPARVSHPGKLIRRELDARGWTQRDFAEIMGRPEQTISEIVRGKKRITERTAIQLGAAFGTSAHLWARLDAHYRLHRTRLAALLNRAAFAVFWQIGDEELAHELEAAGSRLGD